MSLYYTREHRLSGQWISLIMFTVLTGSRAKHLEAPFQLKINYNRNLAIQDNQGKQVPLDLSDRQSRIIFDLLRNLDNADRYRLKLVQKEGKIKLQVYIAKSYIEHLCLHYQVAPRLIETLIRDACSITENPDWCISQIQLAENPKQDLSQFKFLSSLRLTPYLHQLNNVKWMDTVERNVDYKLHTFEYTINDDLIRLATKQLSLYLDGDSNIVYNDNSLWQCKDRYKCEHFKGGVLCDEVGSGKTLSMFSLILSNPARSTKLAKIRLTKPTPKMLSLKPTSMTRPKPTPKMLSLKPTSMTRPKLVLKKSLKAATEADVPPVSAPVATTSVTPSATSSTDSMPRPESPEIPKELIKSYATILYCPRRLVGQWIMEIRDKYLKPGMPFTLIEMSTMVHVNKYTPDDLVHADLVVVSTSLLDNKKYIAQETNPRGISLTKFFWHRVIVDEGHEVLVHHVKRVKDQRINQAIMDTRGRYKWVCTGTPLPDGYHSMQGIVSFLTNRMLNKISDMLRNTTSSNYRLLLERLFRRNTIESSKSQITIPEPEESTDYLEFTPTERALYDGTVDPLQQIQLCTNILVSDTTSSILGNQSLSLDQVNTTMIEHHRTTIDQLTVQEQQLQLKQATLQSTWDQNKAGVQSSIADIKDQIKADKAANQDVSALEELLEEEQKELAKLNASFRGQIKTCERNLEQTSEQLKFNKRQLVRFTQLNTDNLAKQQCLITGQTLAGHKVVIVPSGDYYQAEAVEMLMGKTDSFYDPRTQQPLTRSDLIVVDLSKSTDSKSSPLVPKAPITRYDQLRNQWGTKMAHLVRSLETVFKQDSRHRAIIFSQWHKMLTLISQVLHDSNIEHVFCRGNVHMMSKSIRRFKQDPKCKVILLSSESCSSGSNLTEASHVYLLDTVNADPEAARAIEEQAVARAVRIGQKFSVQVKRMIIRDTVEERHYKRIQG